MFAISDFVFLSAFDIAPIIMFSSSQSSAMGYLWFSCAILQPRSDESASLISTKTERHAQMSKIEESITDNCHFQRNGNENRYTHNVKVMSKLKETHSILDMSTQQIIAAKEEISEVISLVRTGTLNDD
jgi:hypothetical protein